MAFITVTGEVTRTFWNGQGAGIKESWTTNDGDERAAYYSAFFDEPHGLEEGDAGKFSGRLGEAEHVREERRNQARRGRDDQRDPFHPR